MTPMTRVTNSQLSHLHNPHARDRYKAQHITYRASDGRVYQFDSRWELDIFRLIRPFPLVTEIHKDFHLEVLPKTLHFPARKWRVDFKLVSSTGQSIYVECKSVATALHADFKRSLENLSYFHPVDFERLLIVLPDKSRGDLGRISRYLRIPIYPESLGVSASLITASDLKTYLGFFGTR